MLLLMLLSGKRGQNYFSLVFWASRREQGKK